MKEVHQIFKFMSFFASITLLYSNISVQCFLIFVESHAAKHNMPFTSFYIFHDYSYRISFTLLHRSPWQFIHHPQVMHLWLENVCVLPAGFDFRSMRSTGIQVQLEINYHVMERLKAPRV
jgi:hypothetical protein